MISDQTEHSQIKYLNNIVESDHARIKRRLRTILGFKSFASAYRCSKDVETMIMFAKNQSAYKKIIYTTNIIEGMHRIMREVGP